MLLCCVIVCTAWEDSYLNRVNELRADELYVLRQYNIYEAMIIVVFLVLPVWMSLTTFGVYSGTGNVMDAGSVFRVVALFNALRFPLINLPGAIGQLMSGMVSIRRVQAFLVTDNIAATRTQSAPRPAVSQLTDNVAAQAQDPANSAESGVLPSPQRKLQISEFEPMDNSYYIKHGCFKWHEGQLDSALSDITVKIPKGALVAVVGMVRLTSVPHMLCLANESVVCISASIGRLWQVITALRTVG